MKWCPPGMLIRDVVPKVSIRVGHIGSLYLAHNKNLRLFEGKQVLSINYIFAQSKNIEAPLSLRE